MANWLPLYVLTILLPLFTYGTSITKHYLEVRRKRQKQSLAVDIEMTPNLHALNHQRRGRAPSLWFTHALEAKKTERDAHVSKQGTRQATVPTPIEMQVSSPPPPPPPPVMPVPPVSDYVSSRPARQAGGASKITCGHWKRKGRDEGHSLDPATGVSDAGFEPAAVQGGSKPTTPTPRLSNFRSGPRNLKTPRRTVFSASRPSGSRGLTTPPGRGASKASCSSAKRPRYDFAFDGPSYTPPSPQAESSLRTHTADEEDEDGHAFSGAWSYWRQNTDTPSLPSASSSHHNKSRKGKAPCPPPIYLRDRGANSPARLLP